MSQSFDLTGPLPSGRTLIEASAGTGKTYTIATLIARYIAGDLVGPDHDLDAGVSIDQVLVVTFTRAAAAELRDRIRAKLRLAASHLERREADPDAAPPSGEAWLSVFDHGGVKVRLRRLSRLREAIARFDEATITTIHGFCQQALAQSGLRAGGDGGSTLVESSSVLVAEVSRDLLVRELADDPFVLSTDQDDKPLEVVDGVPVGERSAAPRDAKQVDRALISTVTAVLTNAGAVGVPDPAVGGIAGRWSTLLAEAVAEVARRQRERREIGYDRLVSDLADLLGDPATGSQLAAQLATRYPLVLVDEFQDTDRLQWQIFELAFGSRRLITVGDPKQAIYRFRGADVQAYLAAVRSASPTTLSTNHRSDPKLLDALALLFDGATLGHPDIAFRKVAARPGAVRSAIVEPGYRAAVHLRVVPDVEALRTSKKSMEAGAAQRIVLTDVANRVRALLDHGTIITGEDAGGRTTTRAVQPGDIAVLVPSQRRASDAAATLREWGIPSVRARTGSVLESDAAVQWRLLLAGLSTPTRARIARAAGLSWFFDLDPADLVDDPDAAGDTELAALQRELAVLAHRLRTEGVGAFYERLRAESPLLQVVLGQPYGDRNVVDCDHVADLLVAATHGRTVEPLEVNQLLDAMSSGADQGSDDTMRRIETDDQAVSITTIHAAKGLEYPIVLLPFGYTERASANRPYVFNDASGQRTIDVASWVRWSDAGDDETSTAAKNALEARKALATDEVDGDSLRLLYVAMTRAKHRLEVWWAPGNRAGTAAFTRLLLDREGAGPVANSPRSVVDKWRGDELARVPDQVAALVAASNGAIASYEVPIEQDVRRPLALDSRERLALTVADGASRYPLEDESWRSWSFTAIAGRIEADRADGAAVDHAPVAGGTDEPPEELDSLVPTSAPLSDIVGGTTFGTMVHEVLERLDFTAASLPDDLREHAVSATARAGLDLDVDQLTVGLLAAIETPLGPLFDGLALRQIAPRDRLAELSFDLRLGGQSSSPWAIPARHLGDVLLATLDTDDPLRPYAATLAASLHEVKLAGWLTGSIDAVFRVPDGDDWRYVVVDYKSNRLADEAAYRPDRLVDAMTHSNYPLQALLYGVALHRYLGWRLGDRYDPDRHLGGAAYLFVRGMVGLDTPTLRGESAGVFSWRPPTATILGLDAVLGDVATSGVVA